MAKQYLFICGCPRSGTTALTHIFNWHPEVLLGIERYAALFKRRPDAMVRDLFTVERFAEFRPGDCGYSSFEFPEYSSAVARRFDPARIETAAVVGDKITQLYAQFDVFDREPWAEVDVCIVQIIRNVVDVARSYEARLRNPNDNWRFGYVDGIKEWSEAVRAGLEAAINNKSHVRFHVVNYDQLFESGEEKFLSGCRELIKTVGLDSVPDFERGVRGIFRAGGHVVKRRTARGELVSGDEIATHVPPDILEIYDRLRERAITN